MTAALLALLASFSWGTSDFLAGLESRRSTAWTAALGGQLVASLSLLSLLVIAAPDRPPLEALAAPAVGGAIGSMGVVLQYRALALVDMSVVSPIIAGAALVPVLWGTAGGERPGTLQLAGIVCTLAGIVLISRKARREDEPGSLDRRGILLAVLSATAFGLFLVALDSGGEAEPLYTVAVTRTTAVLTLLAVVVIARPVMRLRRRTLPALLVVGALIAAANLSFASATTYGYLSIVGVLGWLNPAITMAWAAAVLHERLRPLQVVAAALVFAGIVCITVG